MNSAFFARWLASSEVISQVLFTPEQPKKNKMASLSNKVTLQQVKLLFGPLVIELVWYILYRQRIVNNYSPQCRWKWRIFSLPLGGSVNIRVSSGSNLLIYDHWRHKRPLPVSIDWSFCIVPAILFSQVFQKKKVSPDDPRETGTDEGEVCLLFGKWKYEKTIYKSFIVKLISHLNENDKILASFACESMLYTFMYRFLSPSTI